LWHTGIPTRAHPSSAMSDGEELAHTAARIVRGLAYTTSKFTRIADWRLAVFFYFCQLAVLIGIVASLIIGKTFLALEVPIGVISSYAYAPTAYAEHQAATSAGTITAPCGNLVRSPRGTPRAIPDHASPTNRLVVLLNNRLVLHNNGLVAARFAEPKRQKKPFSKSDFPRRLTRSPPLRPTPTFRVSGCVLVRVRRDVHLRHPPLLLPHRGRAGGEIHHG
jgi:hypothetical protein